MVVYAPACERNKVPILRVLTDVFKDSTSVLELGSGSGQHLGWIADYPAHLNCHCASGLMRFPDCSTRANLSTTDKSRDCQPVGLF